MQLLARERVNHSPARAQQWGDGDEDLRQWVRSVVGCVGAEAEVVAVYLHGSLASGSFYRPKSDVDLLAIVEDPLTERQRRALATNLLDRHDHRPILGGLELSVVRRSVVESFTGPMSYELHFSEVWAEDVRRGGSGPRGTDPDLAAHCTMTRSRGVALLGPEPMAVIGEVPSNAYFDAVMDDAGWIIDGGILESPFYGVLNLCRCLQHVLEEPSRPPSKDESARWSLATLAGEHRSVVAMALECYRSAAMVPADLRRVHGHRWDEQPLLDFAAYVGNLLRSEHHSAVVTSRRRANPGPSPCRNMPVIQET